MQLMVGLGDLEGLLQPKRFYDSMITPYVPHLYKS